MTVSRRNTLNETQARWRLRCFGRVQHVGFRYTAMYLANKLYLTGWVENREDGSVLLEAQGGTAQLRKFLIQLKSQPHLHIEKTEISSVPPQPYERGFRVRNRTGD
ncbi:MAG: acylphosphatase [Clostridia bacterium]|nr:acylphosphatase [Clostridia bacterium]